jgi:cell division septum initiation protein DivIVA
MGKRAGSEMTVSGHPQDPNAKAAVIRSDIEQTRAEMSRTVNELEGRLSPAHIKEQVLEQLHDAKEKAKEELARDFEEVKGKVRHEIQDAKWAVREATLGKVEHMAHDARETITEAGTSVIDTLKANPIPTALIAVGLGWLLMGRSTGAPRRRLIVGRRDRFGGYHAGEEIEGGIEVEGEGEGELGVTAAVGEKVERVAQDARETAGRVAQGARETAGRVAGQARSKARYAADRARRSAIRVERGVESQMDENPLAVGAVAFALGTVVGLALPHTEREDAWLGERKERLLHRAHGVAEEAIHKAEEVAGSLTEKIGPEKIGQEKMAQERQSNDGGPPPKLA